MPRRLWLPIGDATTSALREPWRLTPKGNNPQFPVLNREHPLSQGLVGCYAFEFHNNYADRDNDPVHDAFDSSFHHIDAYGQFYNGYDESHINTNIAADQYTQIFILARKPAINSQIHLHGSLDTTSHVQGYYIGYDTTSNSGNLICEFGDDSSSVASNVSDGDLVSLAITTDKIGEAAGYTLYENAVSMDTGYIDGPIPQEDFLIGTINDGAGGEDQWYEAHTYLVLIYKGRPALTGGEIQSLHDHPFQIFNHSELFYTKLRDILVLSFNDPIVRSLRG